MNRPKVFNETVFPPVLGPVIISVLYWSPSIASIGTTTLGSIRVILGISIPYTPIQLDKARWE